jgi:ribose transport system substrate-binding protein
MAATAPDIECLDTLYNENDVNNAQSNVENQLATYTDLIGLYGANNVSGDGIALAIQNAGLGDSLAAAAVDADDLEVEALREGNLDAIIVQPPYDQGYACVMDLYKSITTGEMPAKQEVMVSPAAVTAANMDEDTYAALLDPFILKRS